MTKPGGGSAAEASVGGISPCFLVGDMGRSLAFYAERVGFLPSFREPATDPFFAIVGRDSVMLFLKAVDAKPTPNRHQHPWGGWDAYVYTEDPDGLAAEFIGRGAMLSEPLKDTGEGLRGFEITDPDGYVLFFGRPR